MANGVGPATFEMPGEAFDFQDVTSLFEQVRDELEPDNCLLMDEFTLQEAMSTLEIGEPRLDTGVVLKEQVRPPFNPLTPLLPEEVCWILDTAMAFEMEFHAGNLLAHTVYTLLYMHHLQAMEPDIAMHSSFSAQHDPHRPLGLITVVLRVAIQGLMKCVDFTWRELAKGGMYDTEDWQSDKCEVQLLEGVPAAFIIMRLDAAMKWVSEASLLPAPWKSAINARLLLRQTILRLMTTDISKSRVDFLQILIQARTHLQFFKSQPSTLPREAPRNSPTYLAFDPYIGRQLQMATPIRVVTPPSFEDTCADLERLLDGLEEVAMLGAQDRLSIWQTVGDLRVWLVEPPTRVPYIRSLSQTTFYDGFLILNRNSHSWLINQFFYETCGADWDSIRSIVLERWTGTGKNDRPIVVTRLEKVLYRLLTPHFRALFNNPPRRRRYFMKALVEWHHLYDCLVEISENIDLQDIPTTHLLCNLPSIALVWRLSIIREVILSGFQLELYVDEEKPFAYWYAVQVLEEHLKCLDSLMGGVIEGADIQKELRFQMKFLTVLQALCSASFVATIPLLSFNWNLTRPNFFRRYKWAFRADYENGSTGDTSGSIALVAAQPDLPYFIMVCGEILRSGVHFSGHPDAELDPEEEKEEREKEEEEREDDDAHQEAHPSYEDIALPSPLDSVELARSIALGIVDQNESGTGAGMWARDRVQLTQNLLNVCHDLGADDGLPRTSQEMDVFDPRTSLCWDPAFHPWFPRLVQSTPLAYDP